MASYSTANTLEDALAALAAGARPIAGGTDLVVGARQGKKALPDSLVGIHRIPGLAAIEETDSGLDIGALASHAAIVAHPAIRDHYCGLADAAALIGSHATRAQGTIGGNVMNASPAMDTGAPLLCLRATATLAAASGHRTVDLADLWTGPAATTAGPHELLLSLHLPSPPRDSGSAYVRLQFRRQMEIAVVGAAAAVTLDNGTISAATIAITAVAPIIHRVESAEQALIGSAGDDGSVAAAAAAAADAARPIDDVRASAAYRKAMVAVVTRRAIEAAAARARGERVEIPASESTYGS
jgi:CO/xanthine dehydrogenase FAD-binding subunit